MIKLALFDFCETLVSFQTADAFIDYVRKKKGNQYMKILNLLYQLFLKLRILALCNKFIPGSRIGKKMKLIQLRGLSFDDLDSLAKSYYQDIIIPSLVKPIVDELKILAKKDFEPCLVSAGYSIYLKYFAKEFGIKHVIASVIAFDNKSNRCLGILSGRDCFYEEKINRIKEYFGNSIDFKNSISYSDSASDLPMLCLTGKSVVVSRSIAQSWIKKYKFNEIIWS